MPIRLLPAAALLWSAGLASISHAQASPVAKPEITTGVPVANQAELADYGQRDADITVTASRLDVLGRAATASEGSITAKEIALRPIYRPGQLFESIPGLVVTIHSGEGKANQYLIRGYNLDHGTDFANFVDDMPVNRPTNAHGQGYSDLAFLMPQIVGGIDYTKGPYHAAIGDFGSVAAAHTRLVDEIPTQAMATVGTDGYQSLFGSGTVHLGPDQRLLGAVELAHYDGPWRPRQDFRKVNAVLRYSEGKSSDGASLTAMFYQSAGGLITDQPSRAIAAGQIDRFGTLDPSDRSRSLRYSLSAHVAKPLGPGTVSVSAYAIHSTMTLWNNFTHYLDDPVNGDQEQQDENRNTLGFAASYTFASTIGRIESETVIGVQGRYDTNFVDRRHTLNRTTILGYCTFEQPDGSVRDFPTVDGYCNADRVHLLDVGAYIQNTLRWTSWLRSVIGGREEYYQATDRSPTSGTGGSGRQWLFQPKGSLILGPWAKTEFYVSAGRGFHSDDVRGVFGTVPEEGVPLAGGKTSLLAQTTGYEIGLRSNVIPKLQLQLALFRQDFVSELVYNPDSGQDEAGPPSRREGVELSLQYHPFRWLELNTDLSFARSRYRTVDLAAFGLAGPYIADAPDYIYSAGLLIDHLGAWSGGLQWRRLGPSPISDGDRLPIAPGYSEVNLDVAYSLPHGWRVQVGVFNLLQSRDNAAEYSYVTRLPAEPAGGIADTQVHPLEPRSLRLTIVKTL